MTREEQINAVAIASSIDFRNNLLKGGAPKDNATLYSSVARAFFEEGAKYADSTFMEKAEKWIKEKWDDKYTHPLVIESVLEDFRMYMEE